MLKKIKKIGPFTIPVVVLIFVIVLTAWNRPSAPKIHTVTLTEEGFSPKKLAINKHDTIVFRTVGKDSFWPASDLHPAHSIYPEFDPKQPVDPRDSWSFTFNKIGEWDYHDHLHEYLTGSIRVKDKKLMTGKEVCKGNKPLCWKKIVKETLARDGFGASFNLLEELYESDPAFKMSCHSLAHFLGKESYEYYKVGRKVPMDVHKSSFCGYGFYHGIIYRIFEAEHKDINKVKDFCDWIREVNPAKTTDVDFSCYHGLGHAIAEDIPDKKLWNDPHAVLADPLKKCETALQDPAKLEICAIGVFAAVADAVTTKKYPLKFNLDDPYEICRSPIYKHVYKRACYGGMNFLVLRKFKYKLPDTLKYTVSHVEKEYMENAVEAVGGHYVWFTKENDEKPDLILQECRSIKNPDIELSCIVGYALGLTVYGEPDKEYQKSMEFCSLKGLSQTEQRLCFKQISRLFQHFYTDERIQQICASYKEPFKSSCLGP